VPFFVSTDGTRLHYELEGSGPLLLLHLGAGCDADVWRAAGYVEPLANRYQCVLFDHRGHGRSDHPTGVEANHLDRYAQDVAALVEHLGHPRASYFGWSNGFQVGLKAADQHPRMFDSLVLFGGIPPFRTREEIAAITPQRVAALRERGWWLVLDDMVAAEKTPVPQWFLDQVLATDIEPYIAWSQARPDWGWSPWDAFPRVKARTLLLAGELEDPDDLLGEAARLMPDAARIRIPDREHINAFLYSEFVVPRVVDFLSRRTVQATG
jgi:pimeloyl-ACP methyl ester carboxylesterase